MPKRYRWQEWDNSAPTDVDKWLVLYAEDDNVFWATDFGHVQVVVDELIERLSTARADEREKAAQRVAVECNFAMESDYPYRDLGMTSSARNRLVAAARKDGTDA